MRRPLVSFELLVVAALAVACKRDAAPAGSAEASVVADPNANTAASSSAQASASAMGSLAASAEPPPPPRADTTPVEDLTPPESADLENPMVKVGKVVVWGVQDG